MKKIIYLAFCAACMLTFGACSKSKDATLTPQSANVQGDLRDYFTVVERPYIVKYDENGWNKYLISIELQRTDKDFAFDTEGIEPVGYFGQGINGNFHFHLIISVAELSPNEALHPQEPLPGSAH